MKARHIGYAIGAVSVAAGVIDLVARRRRNARKPAPLATLVTAPPPMIVDQGGPVWTRFAADVTDLGTLAVAAARADGPKRSQALTAFALVALVATADYLAARAVQRRALGLV